MSASILPTLRSADRNPQPFRCFRNFQQAHHLNHYNKPPG
jgi:hypothetical protein